MEVGLRTSSALFDYEPLREGSIRLLSLTGIGVDGRPICNLVDLAFDEQAQFCALSYVWGSDVKNKSIECNGKELQVTESVFNALMGLASKIIDEKLPIWVDALCINQADDMEKARQVADMHQIYRRAKVVIVWLGPEDDNSDLAMTSVDRLAEMQFRGFTSVANIAVMKVNTNSPTRRELEKETYLRFSELLPLAQTKQCAEQRDRVFAMLSLTSQTFRDMFNINYQIPLTELYIQCGKACLQQDPNLFYLQLVTIQKRRPDLPSWCLDLQPQELEMMFDDYLRAGLREASTDSNRANVKIISGSDNIEIEGFRADIVDRVVPMDFVWSHRRSVENTKNLVEWESKCRLLACDSLGLSPDEVPIAHVCTLSANIKARLADFEALTQGYRDQITHMVSQAEGRGDCPPPIERQPPYDYFWVQMARACPGRTYFSTKNGRVGIGPPSIQRGDLVAVIYGTEPVFVLRKLPAPERRMEIIGDAFVHGLMDLNETPEEVIGPTEWFVIC